jgi:hypothetical protein
MLQVAKKVTEYTKNDPSEYQNLMGSVASSSIRIADTNLVIYHYSKIEMPFAIETRFINMFYFNSSKYIWSVIIARDTKAKSLKIGDVDSLFKLFERQLERAYPKAVVVRQNLPDDKSVRSRRFRITPSSQFEIGLEEWHEINFNRNTLRLYIIKTGT